MNLYRKSNKNLLSLVSIFGCAAFILTFTFFQRVLLHNVSAADYSKYRVVRVGLKFGTNATAAGNAYAANGFYIGYYDSSDNFVNIYTTSDHFITFAKDKNVYISGNTVSTSSSDGSHFVGSFHLSPDATFGTLDETESYVSNVSDKLSAAGLNLTVFPYYNNGTFGVRIGEFASLDDANSKAADVGNAIGAAVNGVGNIKNLLTVIDMNNYVTIFEFSSDSYWPAAKPIQKDGSDPSYIKTGTLYYHGGLEFKRMTGDDVTVVSVVSMDDYVKGVLPYEMSPSWNVEALKAQAVCARTYAIVNHNKHISQGFNVCDETDCQVYNGNSQEGANVVTAANETSGQLLTYSGSPISTFYHSSNGGYTESVKNVWGSEDKPYYTPVPDTYEDLDNINNGRWSSTVSGADLGEYLRGKNYDISEVVKAYVSEFTKPAGNVYSVTFEDAGGKSVTISKCDTVRIKLSKYVKSPRFNIYSGSGGSQPYVTNGTTSVLPSLSQAMAVNGDGTVQAVGGSSTYAVTGSGVQSVDSTGGASGTFEFKGTGWGHNVGMSQYGALGRAKAGISYKNIVTYYFQGTEVTTYNELKG
ncbi:MAG: SpoIID/LytB domain-containing protein [Bacillota bacterium]|nr:SpoIID/LytB domain-containing protein [Bacillota bacterium]